VGVKKADEQGVLYCRELHECRWKAGIEVVERGCTHECIGVLSHIRVSQVIEGLGRIEVGAC
jgi:hypothetical protein